MAGDAQVKISFAGEDDGFGEVARKEVEHINAVTAAREASNRTEQQRLGFLKQIRQIEAAQRKDAFDRLPLEKQINELLAKRDDLQRRLNNGLAPKGSRSEAAYQAALAQTNFQILQKSIAFNKELAGRPGPPPPPPSFGQKVGNFFDAQFGQFFGANLFSQAIFKLLAVLSQQVRKAIEDGARFSDLADRLRTDTSTAQGLSYAGGKTFLTEEENAVGIKTLGVAQERALAGNKALRESFERYGVSLEELRNKRPDQIYIEIARNFQIGAVKAASMNDAMALFGRSADKVIGAFRGGFAAAFDEISAKGGIIPPDVVKDLDDLKDQLGLLSVVITAKLAPAISDIINRFGPGSNFLHGVELIKATFNDQFLYYLRGLSSGKGVLGSFEYASQQTKAAIRAIDLKYLPPQPGELTTDNPEAEAAERVRVLREKLNELDKAAAFERLNVEEKITALKKEQADLGKTITNDASEEERLNVAIQQAELEKKLSSLENQRKKETPSESVSKFTVDALTRIGGFRTALPDQTQNIMQRQLQAQMEQQRTLSGIEHNTAKLIRR